MSSRRWADCFPLPLRFLGIPNDAGLAAKSRRSRRRRKRRRRRRKRRRRRDGNGRLSVATRRWPLWNPKRMLNSTAINHSTVLSADVTVATANDCHHTQLSLNNTAYPNLNRISQESPKNRRHQHQWHHGLWLKRGVGWPPRGFFQWNHSLV